MTDRVCLVTGASSGIGRATALVLAKMGAIVVLVCKNRRRGEAALETVRTATGNPAVSLVLGDLSSSSALGEIADTVRRRFDRLHVLVNNAGAMIPERRVTDDGLEMTFALNHLGYFRLTNLLLDILVRSAPARIVNVASDTHRFVRLNFEDLQNRRRYSPLIAYAQSKVANVLFTTELAGRLRGSGVSVNSLHPGAVRTNFYDSATGINRMVYQLFGWTFRSPEKGAETVVYLASSGEVECVTGGYFRNRRGVRPSSYSQDPHVARKLWEVSERMS